MTTAQNSQLARCILNLSQAYRKCQIQRHHQMSKVHCSTSSSRQPVSRSLVVHSHSCNASPLCQTKWKFQCGSTQPVLAIPSHSFHSSRPFWSEKEKKEQEFHPPHPSVMERLKTIDERTRLYGYSMLKIGLATVAVGGLIIYFFRDGIRRRVAGEVTDVATRSLSDAELQARAEHLSKALLHEILSDTEMQRQTVQFLRRVLEDDVTRNSLVSLLSQVLRDPSSQAEAITFFKLITLHALQDDKYRRSLAEGLKSLLAQQAAQEAVRDLLVYLSNNDTIINEGAVFLTRVAGDYRVREAAAALSKNVVGNVTDDEKIRRRTGDALWGAFKHSVTPGLFRGKDSGGHGDNRTDHGKEGRSNVHVENEKDQGSEKDNMRVEEELSGKSDCEVEKQGGEELRDGNEDLNEKVQELQDKDTNESEGGKISAAGEEENEGGKIDGTGEEEADMNL